MLLLWTAMVRYLLFVALSQVSYSLNLFLAHHLLERTEPCQVESVLLSQLTNLSDLVYVELIIVSAMQA